MRILLLNPNQVNRYNWGHQLFRNEIGRQHDVVYYGEGFTGFDNRILDVRQIIKHMYGQSQPDLIMTYGWRYSKDFTGLGKVDIPKVHILVDYVRPQSIPKQNKFFARNKYDLIFVITQRAYRLMRKFNPHIRVRILPFSVDTNIYKPLPVEKKDWVLAAFNTRQDVYPNRLKIRQILKQLSIKTVTKATHQKLIEFINKCKISVTSNNIYGSLSMRYTEVLACGGFLLADEPEDLAFVGFEDGKHLVIYKDLEDFKDKVLYYLKHDEERERIAKQGMKFVRKNHSCKKRLQEMTTMIREELKIE